MGLSKYKDYMESCVRCSHCKWVTFPQMKSWEFAAGCPSIQYGNFHAYSGGGKVITALGLLEGRIECTDEMLKTVFACSMCGACDVSCKTVMGGMVEPMDILRELRIKLVEDGEMDPAHALMIKGLKREDNVFGKPKAERSKWAEGFEIKDVFEDKTEVFLHVGCQLSYDEELWPVIRGVAAILEKAGVDFGIAKKEEVCCGGRAFTTGYKSEMDNYAESMTGRVKESGAKILLTCCSDGYGTFKQLYPMIGRNFDGVEVVHITEYIDRLLREEKLALTEEVPLKVTYHDPCNLGRLGEPYEPWDGERKMVLNKMLISEPKREVCFGSNGVFDPPRNILGSIPGLEFIEMERIKEYAYCCGAGGGAKEAFPDFAHLAACERIKEAQGTGAEALVTACPWCQRNFKDSLLETGDTMKVYDIIELVLKALGIN